MKRLVFVGMLIGLMTSCTKSPSACSNVASEGFVVTPVSFINCSNDYEFNFWSFGDGSGSEDVSSSHKYDSPGTYQVKLTVYSDDGRKEDEVISSVKVGYKVVDSILVTSWPFSGVRHGMAFEMDGVRSIEKYDGITLASFPLKYTFSDPVKLLSPETRLKITDEALLNGSYNNRRAKLHADLSNPFVYDEGVKMEFYWHFEYE